jgi:outer membrane protein OmpA-like peptidoglycan-associated protein
MRFFLISLALFSFGNVFSQKQFFSYSLTGVVTEEISKLPVPGATVVLFGSDNTKLEMKTDQYGRYVFQGDAINPHTSYVISATGLDVRTKDFPDGMIGMPKYKFSTRDTFNTVAFVFNPVLRKMSVTDYSPVVVFKQNTSQLYDSAALQQVEDMYKILIENPNISVEVRGHAGVSELNAQELALERAKVVKDQLIGLGVLPERLTTAGVVKEDSVFLSANFSYDHFKQFYSLEQFRTQVFFVITSRFFPYKNPPQKTPEIKVAESKSEGGDTDPNIGE